MDTLVDYVRWMGDFDFQTKPFSDVDGLVISMICYLDMKPALKLKETKEEGETAPLYAGGEYEGRLSLREICRRIEDQGLKFNIRTVGPDNGQQDFMHAAAASKRFGELMIHDYVDVFSHEEAIQFSCMTFDVDEDTRFLAYVGTDHTLAGWKEDFMLSFTHTKGQDMAVDYAERMIRKEMDKQFYIGGQSKGGNLALYAGCMISDEAWDRVIKDYYLDGPGLCKEVTDLSKLERVQEKTLCVGPEYAIVGKLFPVEMKHTKIVKSNLEGIMQHALYSWGVDHGELLTVPMNDPQSIRINKAVDAWMEGISQEERKVLVDELFDALGADGATTLDEIEAQGAHGFESVLVNVLSMSDEAKKMFMELPQKMLDKEVVQSTKDAVEKAKVAPAVKFFKDNRFLKAFAFMGAGLVMGLAPASVYQTALMLIIAGIAVFEIGVTLRRLKNSQWDFTAEKPRIGICIILVMFLIVTLVKEGAMFLLGSMLISTLFFVAAYLSFAKLKSWEGDKAMKILFLLQTLFSLILAFAYLVIPSGTTEGFTLGIAGLFIIDGIYRLIRAIHLRKIGK